MQNRQTKTPSTKTMILRQMGLFQLAKLQQNIDTIYKKNKFKYQKIIISQPTYLYNLYYPNEKLRTQKVFKKQLLLKQLDKLMDDQSILDKKLEQIKFLQQEQKIQIQQNLNKQMNSYTILRNVWAEYRQNNGNQYKNNFQRIQSLNFTIGKIKNTILIMKSKEQQLQIKNKKQDKNQKQRQRIISTKIINQNKFQLKQQEKISSYNHDNKVIINQQIGQKYENLLNKYEKSLMKNQQLIEIIVRLQQKLIQKQNKLKQQQKKCVQNQKQIKILLKHKQIQQIDKKMYLAQHKQQIHDYIKKLQKLQKWKNQLQKNMFQNKLQNFKIYFQCNHNLITQIKNDEYCTNSIITKTLDDILTFFQSANNNSLNKNYQQNQQITNNPEFINGISNQQNNDLNSIMIPTLSLSQSNKNISMRKKISTDRPLKNRNIQSGTYISKLNNPAYKKLSSSINQQSIKFVRKNTGLGTSRKLQTQYSQRTFQGQITQEMFKI